MGRIFDIRPPQKGGRVVNLSYRRVIRLPLKKFLKTASLIAAAVFFAFGIKGLAPASSVPIFPDIRTLAAERKTVEDRAALENKLAELEKQIDEYEDAVVQYRKQGKTLKSEVDKLNSKIGKLGLQIKAVNFTLDKLNQDIASTTVKITSAENDLQFNKAALIEALQDLYAKEKKSLVEIILANPRLSDFFGDLNDLILIQDKLRAALQRIGALREELVDQKEQLALEKTDTETLKKYHGTQRAAVEKTQKEKNELLVQTQGKESKFKELLTETKKTAAQIRSQIFELLGGGELSFEKAYDFAKFAEQATGVRAALILAVLDRESALGQNVGRCNYKTAMHPKRDTPLFLELTSLLGINPDTIQVSCPNRDGAYGGAMGPAQFIPSTWNLYKDQIAQITGTSPSSPWRNGDAFVATALYLKNSGAASASRSQERAAAAKYYAGKRWQNYLWTYGERVISKAEQFQKDIDILNS